MRFLLLLFLWTAGTYAVSAHPATHGGTLQGLVVSAADQDVLAGAVVRLKETNLYTSTNEIGLFVFTDLPNGPYTVEISYLGFNARSWTVQVSDHETKTVKFEMTEKPLDLSDIEITATRRNPLEGIGQLDIQTRPVQSSQDILRFVPGLFIAQHAGGGKAEQIFLRGFDIDHGTDIALFTDGMPVNMVSHAHGQGYADLHFVIPELVQDVDFQKGLYDPRTGNFATAGQVHFNTPDVLPSSFIKLESGQFNTHRLATAVNLLGDNLRAEGTSAYIAAEQMVSAGYFDVPQNFKRRNVFGKFRKAFGQGNVLDISVSDFSSSWMASGQIPERAVASGQIGWFGAIDPTEGGTTGRTNLNVRHFYSLNDRTWVKNQFYRSDYRFELYSNFTFFLEDSINGDQIRQRENRTISGYNGSIIHQAKWGRIPVRLEGGVQLRYDDIHHNELSRTVNRRTTLDTLALGKIDEINAALYSDVAIDLRSNLSVHAGVRFDQFQHVYANALDELYTEKSATRSQVSPRLSVHWVPVRNLELFAKAGSGFHSNDTRMVLADEVNHILPAAWGQDLGIVARPWSRWLVSATWWHLFLEQELVYVGDAGVVEPGGRTRRRGVDLSTRLQVLPWLFFDGDYTYTFSRSIDDPEGANRIPLAPVHTGTGGFSVQNKQWSGSLRTRWLGDRPANADHSLIADGYILLDAQLTWSPTIRKRNQLLDITLSAQNLLNTRWKEAQFETETRLRNELAPVNEIHFTPGTPLNIKAGITFRF
jgi:hypothetical protein